MTTLLAGVALAQTPAPQPSPVQAAQAGPGTVIPGIPNLPDVVTVIPFQLRGDETERTKVLIPAVVDGHRGNFILDTGVQSLDLNRDFLQPNSTGGVDTVTEATRRPEGNHESAHVTLRIGTLQAEFLGPQFGPLNPKRLNTVLSHDFGGFSVFAPRLGNIGSAALEPYETIIDYTHQRLVLIRLDTTGHRMANVSAYTPAHTTPLTTYDKYWWGIRGVMGSVTDSLEIDTGNPLNSMLTKTRAKVAEHLTSSIPGLLETVILDHLVIAGHTIDSVPFLVGSDDSDVLGYASLCMLGVVGFNFRAHQFIVYR